MAAKTPTRVELNLAALTAVERAIAMGLQKFGEQIAYVASSIVPVSDDPRYGHTKTNWGVATYFAGKKVADASADGSATNKPRAFVLGTEMASTIVGYDFPARFLEVGTVDTRAEPFLHPAAVAVAPDAAQLIYDGAAPYWPRKG